MKYKPSGISFVLIIALLLNLIYACTIESDYVDRIAQYNLESPGAASFTVTYDGNGNTGGNPPVDENKYLEGSTVTVLGNSGLLVRDTYSFTGWNTGDSGEGTPYSEGSTFLMGSSDLELYAQWQKKVHYVKYYKNDPAASGTMDLQEFEEGESASLVSCGFLKAGWAFVGWALTPSGASVYPDTADFSMGTSDVDLYAVWSENIHTLSFEKNDLNATGSMSSQNVAEGAYIYLPVCSFTNTGHTFNGWNTNSPGTGIPYDAGAQFQMGTTNTTLYAQWNVNSHTITYYGNGYDSGTVPSETTNNYAASVTIASSGTMSRQGDGFAGWNTNSVGTGTPYSAGQNISMPDADIDLYAQWEPDYSIGDTGPGGGLIFYDKGTYSEGWRFMEAAPSYTEWYSKYWGADGTDILGADGTGLGTGEQNTTDIITHLGSGTTYAGQLCYSLTVGSINDWVLPSKDELILMYTNLHHEGIGGFGGTVYASSTENNMVQIYTYNFSGGYGSSTSGKSFTYAVRAMRSF